MPRAAAILLALLAAALPPTAAAAATTSAAAPEGPVWSVATVADPPGEGTGTPRVRLTGSQAAKIARTSAKLQRWLRDHPAVRTTNRRDTTTNVWTVSFVDSEDVTQAQVLVEDRSGTVTETRTGPQVAWQMARGYEGAFGRSITKPRIWIPLFLLFLVPFVRWRRPFSLHTLDLLMLCAFGLSLVWFNRGEIFTSVPLVYPPLVYLGARLSLIGIRGRRAAAPEAAGDAPPQDDPEAAATAGSGDEVRADGAPAVRPRIRSWCPTWLLVALMLFAVGIRLGLNAFDSNVIDVGYAGVIGADRIAHGSTLYGTFPADCGQCDTYGPLTYLAYVPFEAVAPWEGRWDDLPAAHAAAVMFDLATLAALLMLGWRLGGRRLAAGLGLAWAAFPFTAYALESNTNDSLVAACLAWGLVVAHRPVGRGIAVGLAVAAKFSPAILVPLWGRHPFPRAPRRRRWPAYVGGLAIAAGLTGWVVLLDGLDGVRRMWSRTIGFQLDRESPFSIWGQHPELKPLQLAIAAVVGIGAVVLAVRPRRIDLRALAALSGALVIGVQLTMTHWFYLYIPWFLPFALVALVPDWGGSRTGRRPASATEAPA